MIRRVLVVDDEIDVRNMLSALLEAKDYAVEVAASGRDALRMTADDPPQAIVLDYKMPDLNGMEVAHELRAAGVTSPILLYSAYLTPAIRQEARSLDVIAVSKTDIGQLLHELTAVLPPDRG